MRLQLPSGRQARIGVKYGYENTKRCANCRSITIHLTVSNSNGEILSVEGKSVCSPKDGFCKVAGRQIALLRLFQNQSGWLTRADKTALFQKLCLHPVTLSAEDKRHLSGKKSAEDKRHLSGKKSAEDKRHLSGKKDAMKLSL